MSDKSVAVEGQSTILVTPRDRRQASRGRGARLAAARTRPELMAIAALAVVFVYFSVSAGDSGFLTQASFQNTLEAAAQIGIIAAPACLLLVAGEFDLSVGSMMGAAQILFAYPLVTHGWPIWAAAAFALGACALLGLVNGLLVVKTRIPSFIVTLGALFWINGTAQGITESLTQGTTVTGIDTAAHGGFFGHLVADRIGGYPVAAVWFVVIVAICAWVLHRTAVGNRIFATGGDEDAARRVGVRSAKLKVQLYLCTALAAGLVGILGVYQANQADVSAGTGLELQAVAAAVIGGAALTGGFGSPIGAGIGAVLFGMVSQGFYFTDIPDTWYQTFLGVILILAVLLNDRTRTALLRAGSRRS